MKCKKLVSMVLAFVTIMSLTGFHQNVSARSNTEIMIGAWPGAWPSTSNIESIQNLQQRKLDVVQTFIDWSTNFDAIKESVNATYANGSILMVTWEPWSYDTVKIKNGEKDSYIKKMANDMKAFGKEIWLRPLHEANGNWYPWCIGGSSVNTNETYIAAYRHIVDTFRAEGATNVKWVFNINCSNVGDGASFTAHYPGDKYVDYNSIDGYNWGTTQSWGSKWQSFDEIFSSSYNALKQYNKPIMITEWASAEIGGNKAQWITDSFNTVKNSYDKICALMWFNQNKETNWLINSSTESLNAYIKAVAKEKPSFERGDINKDGSINALDFALMKKYLLGLSPDVTPDKNIWDLNKDGSVTALDFALLKMYILGKISSF